MSAEPQLSAGHRVDPVIEAYKQGVDRGLLIENLKLTTQQRSEKFEAFMELCYELRRNAERRSSRKASP